jgi:hypothetical protein
LFPDEFKKWLTKKAIPELKKECSKRALRVDSYDNVIIENEKYVLRATPNGSFGYLYCVAYEKVKENVVNEN